MDRYVRYEIDESGIATVTLDSQDTTLNVFSTPFMEALDRTLDTLAGQQAVRIAIFRSGKPAGFVAGANLDEIEHISTVEEAREKSRTGQLVFQKIADLPFPTVAAVNGHCMGGGTEMILACDYRLAARDKAKFAFPEVKLGIFPGWGGTQRLPRLISLQKALDMILTGNSYSAYRAYKAGLVDRMVPDKILDDYAREFAGEILNKGGKRYRKARKKKAGGLQNLVLEKNRFGRSLIWRKARENVMKQTGGHYPAPLKALEVIRQGLQTSLEKGLQLEAREFATLMITPEHKNLLRVYRLSERPKKLTGVAGDVTPKSVGKVGVLGAGVMGGGIAQLFAFNDYPVRMKDIAPDMVAEGLHHAESLFEKAARKHIISSLEKDRKFEQISGTTRYDGFNHVDVVVEAVVEKMPVKQMVLKEVEEYLPADAVFASNTSALSITELQGVAQHPERVAGMHFFNPVHRMPLVEVIRGKQTGDTAVATLFDLAKRLGKTPILVLDSPGFLVNRLLGVYLNEACLLAEEGYGFQWLDHQVKAFGMPMGPFRLIDEVGIDIAAEVAETLGHAFQDHLETSELLSKVRETGLTGKKGGKGFYVYEKGHSQGVNSQISTFLTEEKTKQSGEAVRRMLYLMINEAARCLEEGIVASPEDVDTGMVFGTGFPPFRGGLCRYADAEGLPQITETLETFAGSRGKRFQPAEYLRGRTAFYQE